MKVFTTQNALIAGGAYLAVLCLAVWKSGRGFSISTVADYAKSPAAMADVAFGSGGNLDYASPTAPATAPWSPNVDTRDTLWPSPVVAVSPLYATYTNAAGDDVTPVW